MYIVVQLLEAQSVDGPENRQYTIHLNSQNNDNSPSRRLVERLLKLAVHEDLMINTYLQYLHT